MVARSLSCAVAVAALFLVHGMRTADLKLMGEAATTSNPSFWAPFVLVGDGGTP